MAKDKELLNLGKAFQQASVISFSLVFFPITFLLLGVFLDKHFKTTPLFIIIFMIVGIIIGVYQAISIRKKISKQ